jgi:N-acetylneuraminic acid mutarotase
MKRRLNWVGLIGFLVLVGLAGCGGGSGDVSGCLLGIGPDCPPAPPQAPPPPPDTTPPSVIAVAPEASATNVDPHTTIFAFLDRPLDPSSVTTSNFVVRDAASQAVSGVVSYYDLYTCFTSGCGYQISFKPQGVLAFGTQYTVTITRVRNASGYPMTSDYTWSFTVIPAGVGTWQPTTTISAPSGRYEHTAVWTGTRMIVWGGTASNQITATGGLYDPATDTWQATATNTAPSARHMHTAVWTGADMIVWGGLDHLGNLATGGRYTAATDSWRSVSTTNAPPATSGHTAVWTGDRMVVWGGGPYSNNGGIYDPASDTWQSTSLANAPLGRSLHTAVWTGSEMIVWGGLVPAGPSTVVHSNSGGRYNPVTDAWISMSTLGAPEPRESHTAVWTGSKMIVWGGYNTDNLGSGGIYDPVTDTWQTIPLAEAPSARTYHTAVWTGSEMIVWGGVGVGASYFNTGARYNPATSAWATTSNINVPSSRQSHSAVWTGTQMIVWGGHEPIGVNTGTDTGGRYSP